MPVYKEHDFNEDTYQPPSTLTASNIGDFDPRSTKPRKWLIKDRYATGKITLTIAPPGEGKTTLAIQEAIAVAIGKDFARRHIEGPSKAWFYNNEDDQEELLRRVVACCKTMGMDFNDLREKLYINGGEDRPFRVAREVSGEIERMMDVDAAIKIIKRENIGLLFIDHLVEAHSVIENSNDGMRRVAQFFRDIAQKGECAVSIVHHTRKVANGDQTSHVGNADTTRGAGAVVGVARIVDTLYRMTKKWLLKSLNPCMTKTVKFWCCPLTEFFNSISQQRPIREP